MTKLFIYSSLLCSTKFDCALEETVVALVGAALFTFFWSRGGIVAE